MNGIDFASAQQKISEITKIVATVPDGLKEKAFELLFELAFRDASLLSIPRGAARVPNPQRNSGPIAQRQQPRLLTSFPVGFWASCASTRSSKKHLRSSLCWSSNPFCVSLRRRPPCEVRWSVKA